MITLEAIAAKLTGLDRMLWLDGKPNRTPDEEVELQRLAHSRQTAPLKDIRMIVAAQPYGGGQLVIRKGKQ